MICFVKVIDWWKYFNTINSINDDKDDANFSDKHDVVRLDIEVDDDHIMQENYPGRWAAIGRHSQSSFLVECTSWFPGPKNTDPLQQLLILNLLYLSLFEYLCSFTNCGPPDQTLIVLVSWFYIIHGELFLVFFNISFSFYHLDNLLYCDLSILLLFKKFLQFLCTCFICLTRIWHFFLCQFVVRGWDTFKQVTS